MEKNFTTESAEIYNDPYVIERIQILFPKNDAREIARKIDELLKTEFDITKDYTQLYPFALQYQLDDCNIEEFQELVKMIDKKYRQSQNYLNIRDIIIPVIVYKDENNKLFFCLQKTFVPAKSKIYYELPEIIIPDKKQDYSTEYINEQIGEFVKNSKLGSTKVNYQYLTSKLEPVSQSFTNQKAMSIIMEIDKFNMDDKSIQWVPFGAIEELVNSNINMSLQTRYTLLLTLEKFSDIVKKQEMLSDGINFTNDDTLYTSSVNEIWPRKYRFGVSKSVEFDSEIKEMMNKNEIKKTDENSIYGLSKDSVQCVVTRINNDSKVEVLLSKQLRSPFISYGEDRSNFYECPAGMIDDEDALTTSDIEEIGKIAALREAKEETGVEATDAIRLCPDCLLSLRTEESSLFYLCEVPYDVKIGNQNLDDGENIEKAEWFVLSDLDIYNIESPMPTKVALLEAKRYYNKQNKNLNQYIK